MSLFFEKILNSSKQQLCTVQENGNAGPSMTASLIERLPDGTDPQRPMEKRVAQDVTAITFVGWQWYK